MLNGIRVFLGLEVIADKASIELTVDDFLALCYLQENMKDYGHYSMYSTQKQQVAREMRNTDKYWQDQYFFMLVNEKSLGALVNMFFPLWGPFRKFQTKRIKRKI